MRSIPLKRYFSLMLDYIRPLRNKVILLTIFMFAGIGLRIFSPQVIRYFLDSATEGAAESQLLLAAGAFLFLGFMVQVVSVIATYYSEDVGWTATNELRSDLAAHTLELDMSFHNDVTPGEMIERIDGDVMDLAIFFSQFFVRIVGNVILLVGILGALMLEDWRIATALALYAVLFVVGLSLLRKYAVPHWKAARETDAELFGYLEEQLAGTEDIRSSGGVDYSLLNLHRYNRDRLLKQRKAGIMNIFVIQMWIVTYMIGFLIAVISGYFLYKEGSITIGTVYLIMYYTEAIFRPLREITNEIQNLQKAGGSIERVEQLNSLHSQLPDTAQPQKLPSGPLGVEFDRVGFSYNDSDPVLQRVGFHIEPGKVLGLLGRTGSGKTTITRLLFRLYDVNEGAIRLSNIDIRDTSRNLLRHHVGMVTQNVQIFRASVRDNLTFFDRSIPDDHIMAVINELGLYTWFARLPEGLDTELESEGKSLSAGEGQLLAFARVFLKDPGLVILDEASSRLDPATEHKIELAVDKLLHNRTGIIVAHRLKTVQRADHILILDHGQIQEYGAYKDLASNPETHFAQLLRSGTGEAFA